MNGPSDHTQPYLLKELENWLASAAKLRQRSPIDPARMAGIVISHGQAERLIADVLRFQAGYEEEHRQLSTLVVALHDASIAGIKDGKHWSVVDELVEGRPGTFRRALNALLKYLKD